MNDTQQKATAHSTKGDRSQNNTFNPNSSRNSHYQRSGKNRPCPICGRTKDQDCCWNEEVILCHTYPDSDVGVDGYIYRGRKDIWGMYFRQAARCQKRVRSKDRKEFFYPDRDGNPLVKVVRIDDGKGKKRFWQESWNGKRMSEKDRSRVEEERSSHPVSCQK